MRRVVVGMVTPRTHAAVVHGGTTSRDHDGRRHEEATTARRPGTEIGGRRTGALPSGCGPRRIRGDHWMRSTALAVVLTAALLAVPAGMVGAQTPANDPSARLRTVLPADVAERVLAHIAAARARQLPTAALENRALKFAAKGVAPADIERAVAEQATRMVQARDAITRGRGRAQEAEIEAGAEALRLGVQGAQLSALAREAPSGRSLAVPLYVIGSLVDRGLPSQTALERVQARLVARATDAELERLPVELPQASARGQVRRAEAAGAGGAAGSARPETPPGKAGSPPGRSGGAGQGPPTGQPGGAGQGKPAGPPPGVGQGQPPGQPGGVGPGTPSGRPGGAG